ncbi:hypothetical protein AQUCO_02300151v1 [Aquilegia coerulea]|uniref:BZIP domain-containing protein n=1 Tax=Aquilegia coerulea TaxID=218851 RepID=A0A2G5DCE2_AQUCA|nr:hypothetical protein AQUCO_02300151v1 [Aquilegia coerulea]
MASSKVMPSSNSTNSDLARQGSTYSLTTIGDLQSDPSNKNTNTFGSMSMDELIRNIYGDNPPSSSDLIPSSTTAAAAATPGGSGGVGGDCSVEEQESSSFPLPKDFRDVIGNNKTVDEVWKEISGSSGGGVDPDPDTKMRDVGGGAINEMTLEEFLTKAGAVREEDMKIPQIVGPVHGFVVDPPLDTRYPQQQGGEGSASGSILWLGNGGDRAGGGRGKRRAVLEPIDKVAQQRQRRMIKNRESAARSRERKQAYTVELESLVTQLEEENTRLLRERAEQYEERKKQLFASLIPVTENQVSLFASLTPVITKQQPRLLQKLRRTYSTQW